MCPFELEGLPGRGLGPKESICADRHGRVRRPPANGNPFDMCRSALHAPVHGPASLARSAIS
jgi:hypothetical protein